MDGFVLKGCVPTREGVTGWACTEGLCTYQGGCDWMGLY